MTLCILHMTTTKLYCSVREAVCAQFAQSHYVKVEQVGTTGCLIIAASNTLTITQESHSH